MSQTILFQEFQIIMQQEINDDVNGLVVTSHEGRPTKMINPVTQIIMEHLMLYTPKSNL